MASSSTPQTPAKKNACETEQGIIGQLPDSILHHVLSFLRTRNVVRTCLVSRRWRNLWTSSPYLSFSYEDFTCNEESSGCMERFITAVLLLRDESDVHTFRLKWYYDFDLRGAHHLAMWIQYAVRHNVRLLDIDVALDDDDMVLPSCIFTCRFLEELKLEFGCVKGMAINPPNSMRLGLLRKLHLRHASVDRDPLKVLVSGCPVLENLEMRECWLVDLDISSHSLRSLIIETCEIGGATIRISVPGLLSLDFVHNEVSKPKVLLENLSSLVYAFIQIDDYRAQAMEFVISSVMQNLEKLKLNGRSIFENFQAVAYFLECSPNLDKLKLINDEIIEQNIDSGSDDEEVSWVFKCPHFSTEVIVQCGEENEGVTDLVTDVVATRCDCSRK